MPYTVEIKDSAVKTLAALPQKHRRQISARIDGFRKDPRPSGCEKLRGADDF